MTVNATTKTKPTFKIKYELIPGGAQSAVTAWYGGKAIHVDTFNLGKATARDRFAKATAEKIRRAGGKPILAKIEAALMNAHTAAVQKRDAAACSDRGDEDRPTIQCNGRQLDEITAEAMEAIGSANDPPTLFLRGGNLVRLRDDETTGLASTEHLDVNMMRLIAAERATWVRRKPTAAGTTSFGVSPPLDVVQSLLVAQWPEDTLPPLDGIVECPTFAADGTLVANPGYDESSRLLYKPAKNLVMPRIPTAPTDDEIKKARILLRQGLFGDFPFEDKASRTNAIALLLQPFVRPMIAGPTPLFLISAATAGTGKGLLADVVSIVATGHTTAPTAPTENDDEWRKRIFAAMRADPAILMTDNINNYLDSAALASALTARQISDRPLGESEFVTVPVRCTWIATGNNPRMSHEVTRRAVTIRLVSPREDPQNRPASDFKHPQLLQWATENRGLLIAAALTLVNAWLAEGRPDGGLTVGSYEDWSRVMGGIMNVIGCGDFMANAARMAAQGNDDNTLWRAVTSHWWEAKGGTLVGVAELFPVIRQKKLLEDALGDGNDRSQRSTFGRLLRRRVGTVCGGLKIVAAADARSGAARYRLEQVSGSDATAPRPYRNNVTT